MTPMNGRRSRPACVPRGAFAAATRLRSSRPAQAACSARSSGAGALSAAQTSQHGAFVAAGDRGAQRAGGRCCCSTGSPAARPTCRQAPTSGRSHDSDPQSADPLGSRAAAFLKPGRPPVFPSRSPIASICPGRFRSSGGAGKIEGVERHAPAAARKRSGKAAFDSASPAGAGTGWAAVRAGMRPAWAVARQAVTACVVRGAQPRPPITRR